MKNKLLILITVLCSLTLITSLLVLFSGGDTSAFGVGGRQIVWLGPNSGIDVGDVTLNNTNDLTVTLDGEAIVVSDITTGTVQVTGVSNVTISEFNETSDITITLDSEVVSVDVTNTDDITVTLGGESVDTELPAAAALAEGVANPTVPMVGSAQMTFNDTTWDRDYGNWDTVPYASGVRTTGSWVDLTNYNARGAYLTLNVTGVEATPSIVVEAWIYDSASSQFETVLTGIAVTATGRHSYLIYPGAGAAANAIDVSVSYPLPRRWAVAVIHDDSDPITYSIGCAYIR